MIRIVNCLTPYPGAQRSRHTLKTENKALLALHFHIQQHHSRWLISIPSNNKFDYFFPNDYDCKLLCYQIILQNGLLIASRNQSWVPAKLLTWIKNFSWWALLYKFFKIMKNQATNFHLLNQNKKVNLQQ